MLQLHLVVCVCMCVCIRPDLFRAMTCTYMNGFQNSLPQLLSSGSRSAGLPLSEKNIWKMKFFPGQGKVMEFCGWSGKFRKDLESQEI